MANSVMVISVHPDDETLGCGGTLLKHRDAGDPVHWMVVTQAFEPVWDAETVRRKLDEVESVAREYDMASVQRLGFPANGLDTVPFGDVVQRVRSAIAEADPDLIYVVSGNDIHTDHCVTFRAVTVTLKPFHTQQTGVKRILCYETLSSTEAAPPLPARFFMPQVFSDISPYLERKLQIMRLYESEVQQEPLPRSTSSLRALARHRGATVGVPYAEAFQMVREII